MRLVLALIFFVAHSSHAFVHKKKSLYEVGVATVSITVPDYPGSNEYLGRLIPTPYFVYRGEVVRSDEEGALRGRFFKSEDIEFDLSFGAAFPVNSKNNKARQGMDDLGWLGELGPRLKYKLLPSTAKDRMWIEFPLRFVFSTDFKKWDHRGFRFAPTFYYQVNKIMKKKFTISYRLGAIFATEPLMEYFYNVPQKDVTAERPYYQAKGGFLGAKAGISLSFASSENLWWFTSLSHTSYEGAVNLESPLFKTKSSWTGVIGFVWSIYQSEDKVKPPVLLGE